MDTPFIISRDDGSIRIQGVSSPIGPGYSKSAAEAEREAFYNGGADHGNGVEWIYLDSLSFGGQPSALSLCFRQGRLVRVEWSVNLPDAELEEGWPTRGAMEKEIAFTRSAIAAQWNAAAFSGHERLPWGEICSKVDDQDPTAVSMIRYATPPG